MVASRLKTATLAGPASRDSHGSRKNGAHCVVFGRMALQATAAASTATTKTDRKTAAYRRAATGD